MQVVTLPTGTKGFDTSARLSLAQAKELYAADYRFAMRYASVPKSTEQPDVLTNEELADLHAAGLVVGVVQIFQQAVNISPPQGSLDGASLAQQMTALNLPPNTWGACDLEGVYHDKVALQAYLKNWWYPVKLAGFKPALYCGPQNLLTAADLMALPFQSYWQGGGITPTPRRGFQMIQLNPADLPIAGTAIDVDVVGADYEGSVATFAAA